MATARVIRAPAVAAALTLLCCSGASASWSFPTSSNPSLPSGSLSDTTCDIEAVELANEQQIHAVIDSLASTTFFRLINVNMDTKCQYFGVKQEDEEPACEGKAEEPALGEPEPVPLCSLGSDDAAGDPFGFSAASPAAPAVDQTISRAEDEALSSFQMMEEDCSNEELPTFWMDMCSHISTNSSDYVNLQLNPERYTGYNGSHVWEAIYKENCLVRTGGHDDSMCYEERVLYRLLSGMHAATNTHVARFYHAPSKRKNRTEWEPDVAYFTRQFRGYPERLRNMHFAFVVLLRAVRRASPYLSSYR